MKSGKTHIFVIFGATGDLAVKKLFPAFEALHKEGLFSDGSSIIAVSRRDWNDEAFREHLNGLGKDFLSKVFYSRVDIDADTGYGDLSKKIAELKKRSPDPEVVAYLSLSPKHQPKAIRSLFREGIISKGHGKILLEKPFGTDEASAKELDELLLKDLSESQICRVDHYLGKDTVRAVMDLHESTGNFSLMLSRDTIESIRIRLFEQKGIGDRGETYDHVGAFRDVGQNHILEMLAVIAADVPHMSWQKARLEVLKHLTPPAKTCELSRRGQYEGYRTEKGVKPDSETETAFEVITSLSEGKLAGVPIILEAGKKMPVSEVFIEISFREIPDLPEKMTFHVQPVAEIVITYPDGKEDKVAVKTSRDAYGNVIKAAIDGSSREFAGSEEIEALWRYADHVVACWEKVPLEIYSNSKPFLIK